MVSRTPRYTFDVKKDVEKADEDTKLYVSGKRGEASVDEVSRLAAQKNATENMKVQPASFKDFMRHYSVPKNGMLLAG
jgi:PHS family inorganic phosphate transporter-like MFS transporter